MESKQFYEKVDIFNDESTQLGIRLKQLLDEVVSRLPDDEEQFHMQGQIGFHTRDSAILFWQQLSEEMPQFGQMALNFARESRDGNCFHVVGEDVDNSRYIITIIIDRLNTKSDNYVKGLIVHELAEMSHTHRQVQKELPFIMKMKPKARQVRLSQLGSHNFDVGTKEHEEHEQAVNKEAIRLGFGKEIQSLETGL